MKADELKPLAVDWLRARFPEAHITCELSLAEYGGALIDVGAICSDQIVGVEIKGDGDSASRLKLQGQMYSRVCRSVYLLPSLDLLKSCKKHIPPEWRMLVPPGGDLGVHSSRRLCPDSGISWGSTYGSADPKRGEGYGLSPAALAAMVWTTEYGAFRYHIQEKHFTALPSRKADFIRFVAERYPLPVIETAVCATLRERNWNGLKEIQYPEVTQ